LPIFDSEFALYLKSHISTVGVATTLIVCCLCQAVPLAGAELDEALLKRFQNEAPKAWKKQVELDKKFEVTGNVRFDSKTDQIVMTGERMTGDLQKEDKKTVANNVRVRGDVAISSVQNNGFLNITGNEMEYDLVDATFAKAVLRGNVKLDFVSISEKAGDADLTAAKIEATFKRKVAKDDSALQVLKVDGPLVFKGVSVSAKGKANIIAKADRMSYEKKGDGAEMLLSGNIYFDQKGPEDEDSADVTGAQSVILTLNKANEVVGIRMSSEGIGKIVTKIKKKGGERA
jgi:cytoskeletal protein CcmA (bactofilin family)